MKRILTVLLAYAVVLTAYGMPCFGAEDGTLIINGENPLSSADIAVISIDASENQMLADSKKLGMALGATVGDGGTILTMEGKTLSFTVGSDTASVDGNTEKLEVVPQTINGNVFVPVEFCADRLGYQVLHERAGKRVRIISRTGLTAPAVSGDIKKGMAALDTELSQYHRPVPTEFEKSNRLDDLLFYTDYSADDSSTDGSQYGEIPDGEEVFSFDDFVKEMNKSDDGVSDWYDTWLETSVVDADDYENYKTVTMKADMQNVNIGTVKNGVKKVPFDKALRLKIKQAQSSINSKAIGFEKRLPTTTRYDKYVLTFYARLIDGGDYDYNVGRIAVQIQGDNSEKSTAETVSFGKEWKRFDFLATGVNNANYIRFISAFYVQTIEIGGFSVKKIANDADVSYFEKTKVDLLAPELAKDAKWRADALDRIEKVRKGDFKVKVLDKNGNPVPNARVKFDMFEHEFKFGVCMDIEYVPDEVLKDYHTLNSDGVYEAYYNGDRESKFLERIGSNFNSLVVGNRLKWSIYSDDKRDNPGKRSTADLVIDQATERGLKYVRGHALWMPANSYDSSPNEVYSLLTDERALDVRYNELLSYIREHFKEMNEKFPQIYEWDVTNETHGRTYFTNTFRWVFPDGVAENIFKDIYKIADETLTNGQKRVLCDNDAQMTEQYWDRLDWFKENGIQYDTLGMQGHMEIGKGDVNNSCRPTRYLDIWDRYAYEYGKDFAITEFSVGAYNDGYGQKGQADFLRDMLIAAYSHPACNGFTFWWMADYWIPWDSTYHPTNPDAGGNGAGLSPLYDRWFNAKPGLNQYQDLVYNKWWTRNAVTQTDKNGSGTVRGFYGDYDVSVSVGGKEVKTVMAAFHKGYENELTITIE